MVGVGQVTSSLRIAQYTMEEQAESQTSNDGLCVGGESGDVLKPTTPQVELQGKGGKDQGITSQKTEQIDPLATYHKDLTDGTRVNLTGEQLKDLICLSKQVYELISTLQDCVDDDSITTDDGTRLNEKPKCELCSVTKDRIKRIDEEFQLCFNTWVSVVQEIRQEFKEMSNAIQKQKGELLEIEEELDSLLASLAGYQ